MANHLDLEEQEQLDQLKHFWNTWGTLISSVVLVVAGSAAAWNGYQYWQNRQATQAAALFDAVDVAARSGDKTRLEQAFGDLKSKYGSTTQAGQAGLTFAKAMQDTGNADAAKASQAANGGELTDFDGALLAAYTDMSADVTRIRKNRAERRRKMMEQQNKS